MPVKIPGVLNKTTFLNCRKSVDLELRTKYRNMITMAQKKDAGLERQKANEEKIRNFLLMFELVAEV